MRGIIGPQYLYFNALWSNIRRRRSCTITLVWHISRMRTLPQQKHRLRRRCSLMPGSNLYRGSMSVFVIIKKGIWWMPARNCNGSLNCVLTPVLLKLLKRSSRPCSMYILRKSLFLWYRLFVEQVLGAISLGRELCFVVEHAQVDTRDHVHDFLQVLHGLDVPFCCNSKLILPVAMWQYSSLHVHR